MNLSVHCSAGEFRAQALEIAQETGRALAEIHDCLSQRGERVLASLLRGLAAGPSGGEPPPPAPDASRYRPAFAIADTRGLLAAALAAKRRACALFEEAARQAPDPEVARIAARHAAAEIEGVRRLEQALERIPRAADWEVLLEQGTAPGLALGAERRLRREPDQNPTAT